MLEPETLIQILLCSLEDYAWKVLTEASARGLDVAPLKREMEGLDSYTSLTGLTEVIDDALDKLNDAGYPAFEDNDHLYIYTKGTSQEALNKQFGL